MEFCLPNLYISAKMFTNSGIYEVVMERETLKTLFEEYWFDNQYLKEKLKEVETVNKLLLTERDSELLINTKKYEEAEMSKIIEKKKYIESLIQELSQPFRTIMYMKYITFLTFDQIADRMNYSTKRIYQLHTEALNKLLNVINNEKD